MSPEHPVEAAWWDEERNGWVYPGGILVPAEIVGGRDLPEQYDRAEPFGITYEQGDIGWPCTCDVDLLKLHDGTIFVVDRQPNPTDQCPLPGHDEPERARHARH